MLLYLFSVLPPLEERVGADDSDDEFQPAKKITKTKGKLALKDIKKSVEEVKDDSSDEDLVVTKFQVKKKIIDTSSDESIKHVKTKK